ncbi:Fic family protein [Asticcacaulis sp. AND118]|uniref:Fic family protein n=1 Tax=Asticcacaulis sp. AND118 TaxID=2840468 RepID=UPI001D000355|nr:Fic family protein [Asticcacaulis sp. AND118]
MFVHSLVGTENNPIYQQLAAENLDRQYSFLRSIVRASIDARHPLLSNQILKALNYHAITCLHPSAGEFRPCEVRVGNHLPPPWWEVPAHMQMFTNEVNFMWNSSGPIGLAAYVLWKLNYIHPFINGNGRTARVACHYVICAKAGGWLPGTPILPELITANRPEYYAGLRVADQSLAATGNVDLAPLHALLQRLLSEQLASAEAGPSPDVSEEPLPGGA